VPNEVFDVPDVLTNPMIRQAASLQSPSMTGCAPAKSGSQVNNSKANRFMVKSLVLPKAPKNNNFSHLPYVLIIHHVARL
jgi:hypothetical protein